MHLTVEVQSEENDARLVEMVRNGDKTAYDVLVRRFQRPVHAAAFAVIADREASLDILQDSFIAAYRSIDRLNDPSRFGPWVCGIARNKAKQFLRDHSQTRSMEVPYPETGIATSNPAAGDTHGIREAMSLLTEMQADIVTLFYMEGYSVKECAQLLDVPEGTIKRRLHDARQRLKKELTDMIKKQLPEYALPEDYRVVLDKPSPIHSTRPSLTWFKDRWVLLWQDGVPWEPYDGPFWFWISESRDGKDWSEPRKLDLPKDSDEMRYHPDYLQLMNCCVVGDKLVFLTHQFTGHMDMYSSGDTLNWTIHPRFRMGMVSRTSIFSSGTDLYMVYPSLFVYAGCGNRVDILRSSDGGFSWTWLNSPYWGSGVIYDVAGTVVDGRIYVAWRELLGKWTSTGHVNAVEDTNVTKGEVTQRVHMNWSDDDGQTWACRVWCPQEYPDNSGLTIYPLPDNPEPVVVEQLDVVKPYVSNSLRISAFGDTLAIAQGVHTDYSDSQAWVSFSRDGGLTWPEKAVYKPGALIDTDIAFGPDGSLLLAGSSRTNSEARPWVVCSTIER